MSYSHAPEPWGLIDLRANRKDYQGLFQITSKEGFIIADIWNVDMEPAGIGTGDVWGDVTADTVSLLFAAPRMLTALKAFVKFLDTPSYDREDKLAARHEADRLARAVIKEVEEDPLPEMERENQ